MEVGGEYKLAKIIIIHIILIDFAIFTSWSDACVFSGNSNFM